MVLPMRNEEDWLVVSTHSKNISQKGESFPNRGEKKKYLKPPTRRGCFFLRKTGIPARSLYIQGKDALGRFWGGQTSSQERCLVDEGMLQLVTIDHCSSI